MVSSWLRKHPKRPCPNTSHHLVATCGLFLSAAASRAVCSEDASVAPCRLSSRDVSVRFSGQVHENSKKGRGSSAHVSTPSRRRLWYQIIGDRLVRALRYICLPGGALAFVCVCHWGVRMNTRAIQTNFGPPYFDRVGIPFLGRNHVGHQPARRSQMVLKLISKTMEMSCGLKN